MTTSGPTRACLGIDFGTTTSLAAWGRPVRDGRRVVPEIIPAPQDATGTRREATPTLIYFPPGGGIVVGEAAREQLGLRPDRVVRRLKLLLGRVDRVDVAGRGHDPTALAAAVLSRLRSAAEEKLGRRVREAVITVPASFDARRRRAVLEAAARAGFDVTPHMLLDEPLAALASWADGWSLVAGRRPPTLDPRPPPWTVLVLDVGGGTSDACVARLLPTRGGPVAVEPLALSRYTPVGGDDFDALVARTLIGRFCERSGLDLESLPPADRLLLEHRTVLAAERVKMEVSAGEGVAEVRQMFLHGAHHLVERVDRRRYAEIVAPLLADPRARAERSCQSVLDAPIDALAKAGVDPSRLDLVLLAGGMANVPAVQDAIRSALGVEPVLCPSPQTAIVAGAVLQHFALVAGLPHLRPAGPIAAGSIGVRTGRGGFRRLIGAGTPLPASVREACAFAVPSSGARYVRIPVCEGEGDGDDRILVTLALRFPSRVQAGEPIVVEASMDANKLLSVRAWLQRLPGLSASVRISPEPGPGPSPGPS